MGLLAPLFLTGLAALAVPVLIHLIQREKNTVVRFPSLMFVRKVPYESVRRRKIRNWALLALRLAALLLLVAAFARPFLRVGATALTGGAREVVVLVDRSYSMGYGDRWTRAQAAARGVLESLAPGDRASLVFFGSTAEIALQSVDDRARLDAALAAATPGPEATRFAPAVKVAGSVLAESTRPRKEVVLISDFQKSAWAATDDDRLPSGVTLTTVPVTDTDTANLAVTPISVRRERFEGQERAVVTAGVTNRGIDTATGVALALEVNGRALEQATVTVSPQASASATFAPITLTPAPMRLAVRVNDAALAIDNAYYAVLTPTAPIRVLVVESGRAGDAMYLTRALAIGQSPRFDVTTIAPDALDARALASAQAVIVQDAPIGDAAAAALAAFVDRGGGVLVATGARATWPQQAIFPGTLGAPVDRTRGETGRLGGVELGHAIFAPFRAARSGDFSSVQVYGYRRITPAKTAEILARFDDGQPAVVAQKTGRGQVVAFLSTFDLSWNDLALKPVFLPFVHQALRTLAGYDPRPASVTVGQVVRPDPAPEAATRVVVSPNGTRAALEAARGDAFEVTVPGFYDVRDAARDTASLVVAANVDLAESDLAGLDPATVAAGLTGAAGGTATSTAGDGPPRDEVAEQSQRLWWYLLLAGMLLLIGEHVLASRVSGGTA